MEYTVDEVYGLSRNIPLNYVERRDVDERLRCNLNRDKHITIFGSSKQGKTCLRKHCLNENDYILVQCSNRWSLSDLNANILKRAGYELTEFIFLLMWSRPLRLMFLHRKATLAVPCRKIRAGSALLPLA